MTSHIGAAALLITEFRHRLVPAFVSQKQAVLIEMPEMLFEKRGEQDNPTPIVQSLLIVSWMQATPIVRRHTTGIRIVAARIGDSARIHFTTRTCTLSRRSRLSTSFTLR